MSVKGISVLEDQGMEIRGASYLYTLAALMITFSGFSALLLFVRPAAGAKLSLLDRYLAKTVMTYVFFLTAGALLPPLFGLFEVEETTIWRGAGVLFGLPMLALQASYPHRRRKMVGAWPPLPIFAVFVVLGSAVTFAMIVCVLAGTPHDGAIYIAALTADFFTVIFGFLTALEIILQQPMEAVERITSQLTAASTQESAQ